MRINVIKCLHFKLTAICYDNTVNLFRLLFLLYEKNKTHFSTYISIYITFALYIITSQFIAMTILSIPIDIKTYKPEFKGRRFFVILRIKFS